MSDLRWPPAQSEIDTTKFATPENAEFAQAAEGALRHVLEYDVDTKSVDDWFTRDYDLPKYVGPRYNILVAVSRGRI